MNLEKISSSILISAFLTAAPALAYAETMLISNLENFANERVTISGMVSWVENEQEFTLADNTGDIEINLENEREGLSASDFVTVVNEIDSATVTVLGDDYTAWDDAYYKEYEVRYDRNGFDSVYFETVDWDKDSYDDYYLVPEES